MKKIARVILFVLLTVFLLPSAASAKSIKMTVYRDVIKSGNTVYCNVSGGGLGIYRVNLKNGKVKRLAYSDTGEGSYFYSMSLKGNYIYFLDETPVGADLFRTHILKGGVKPIIDLESPCVDDYAISGNKLYFNADNYGGKCFVSKLNGKGRKRTKIKPVLKQKITNKKGYKVVYKGKKVYLKTPKKKIYLGENTY